MKKIIVAAISILILCSSYSFARDDIGTYSISSVISTDVAKAKLGSDISFYFGDESYGEIVKEFGVFKTNKKTNAFGKSDSEACNWVFLSAMIALKQRAINEGGNAVVEIKSNYKNNLTSSSDEFKCGAGTIMAGVALVGKVVTIE
ncbi:excinuclease [Marinomonas sp. 5E14-1]|uniref:excinuclease n=1 Tax=Marinomonas sp. 5E14-1 TaxID=3153922 RepID=UPI003262F328